MEAPQTGQTGDQSQVSTETPNEGSNLTTPQGDQPIPSEPERTGEGQQTQPSDGSTTETNAQDAAPSEGPTAEDTPPQDSGAPVQDGVQYSDPFRKGEPLPERDQVAEEEQRQRELAAQRQEHNARTGGGEVQDGELQAANERHLEKTAGTADTSAEPDDSPQGD